MKSKLLAFGVALAALALVAATVVVKISQFPNVTTPGTNDLFLIAVSGITNKNIKYSDLKTAIVSGVSNFTGTNITAVTINNTTNIFNVAKGGHLTVSTNITIQTNATLTLSNLPAPSVLVLGTNRNVANATLNGLTLGDDNTLTATGGGGDTTGTNIVALTQAGTNAAQMDWSLVARGGVFKLALTNNAYFGTPANVANTSFKQCWLIVQQPGTGTCLVTFTNGQFSTPEGSTLINDTNNSAVTVYQMISDVFTNGLVHVSMTPRSKPP